MSALVRDLKQFETKVVAHVTELLSGVGRTAAQEVGSIWRHPWLQSGHH
jgi:hypothetical protein